MNVVELKNVSFSYIEGGKKILDDVTLTMERGKSYAFIGATGEGKSTTASLISKLYKPDSGEVLFEDKNVWDWSDEELYYKIGFILQEPFLFSGTVLDNIVYGNPEFQSYSMVFDEDGVKECEEYELFMKILEEKGLSKLIDLFPDGLQTEVSDNSENISLGQKQVVNFLRIIIREPDFLILDEATANLDTVTEKLLQEILDSLPKTTTRMIIAHRLNTVKNADQVFLVGGGKIKPGEL